MSYVRLRNKLMKGQTAHRQPIASESRKRNSKSIDALDPTAHLG